MLPVRAELLEKDTVGPQAQILSFCGICIWCPEPQRLTTVEGRQLLLARQQFVLSAHPSPAWWLGHP